MKTYQRLVSILLVICMLTGLFPVSATEETSAPSEDIPAVQDAPAPEVPVDPADEELAITDSVVSYTLTETVSGYCGGEGDGTNLAWALTTDGTLTISGTGTMEDYIYSAPWNEYSDNITSIIIGNKVTSIGRRAFFSIAGLTSISIPESVTSISQQAFEHCSNLTSIIIPDGVPSIGYDTFYGCTSLTEVTIPTSVTSIDMGAFMYCQSLASINIPNGVASIGRSAFEWCSSLMVVNVPTSVTNIEQNAFFCCDKLTDVFYSGTQEQWNQITTGSNNENLTSATIHYNSTGPVVSISGTCGDNLTWVLSDNGVLTISGTGPMDDYRLDPLNGLTHPWKNVRSDIKTIIISLGVTSIGEFAFRDCTNLTNIVIADSVTSIGLQAFYNCASLTAVTIPDSITAIGNHAFYDCALLKTAKLSSRLTSLPKGLFQHCTALQSISIPDGVTAIGEWTFSHCLSLESVTIPTSVISVGDHAFSGCSSLTSVLLPESVTSIGEMAFEHCGLLTELTIPANFGVAAFRSCSNLLSVTLLDGITSISSYAFMYCDSLTTVRIPDSVTTIDGEAFNYSENITDVYYSGTEEQWNQISISTLNNGNAFLTSATIHYNSTVQEPNDDYILIATASEFYELLNNNKAGYFRLSNDIDLLTFNDGVWKPIGTNTDPFTGVLDGAGFTIKNLNLVQGSKVVSLGDIATATTTWAGVFGCTQNAIVKNLQIEIASCDVKGASNIYLGGLVGRDEGSVLDNIAVLGACIKATPGNSSWAYHAGIVGGIVGYASTTTQISGCHNYCDLYTKGDLYDCYAGGITGYRGVITLSSNSGNISASCSTCDGYVGGISAYRGDVSESYNCGDVSINVNDDYHDRCAGGITGYAGHVENSYNTGAVTSARSAGGITAKSPNVEFSYSIGTINGNPAHYISGNENVNAEDMSDVTSYVGFDFDHVWVMSNGYPKLRNNMETVAVSGITLNKTDITLTSIGATEQLIVTIQPANAPDKRLAWSSGNSEVATVDANGVVTAVGEGTTTVLVSTLDGKFYAACEVTVKRLGLSEKSSIVQAVHMYTSEHLQKEWSEIVQSGLPDDITFILLTELCDLYGIEFEEFAEYMRTCSPYRLNYSYLLYDDNYIAHHYSTQLDDKPGWRWVVNTVNFASALTLGGELNDWLNFKTYVEADYPGVRKYKTVLLEFMSSVDYKLKSLDTAKELSKMIKSANDANELQIISQLRESTTQEAYNAVINSAQLKKIYVNSKFGQGLERVELSNKSGFGKFAKAMGITSNTLSITGMSYENMMAILHLDATLNNYMRNKDFLTTIVNATEDIPFEMRWAAQQILDDLDEGMKAVAEGIVIDIIDAMCSVKGLDDAVMNTLAKKYAIVGSFSQWTVLVDVTSFVINAFVDVGAMLERSSYVEAYNLLATHQKKYLTKAADEFLANDTEENAWEFVYNYELLRSLRISGEECYLLMCDVDGFLELAFKEQYEVKKEAIQPVLDRLSECAFYAYYTYTGPNGETYITGTFKSEQAKKQTDMNYPFTFSESYFEGNSKTYHHPLATMSLSLAMAAYNSETLTDSNVKDLLDKCGFSEYKQYGYCDDSGASIAPQTNSIAASFAQLQLDDATLIVIAVRGGRYLNEWGGNFHVGGSSLHHSGFNVANWQVIEYFRDYLSSYTFDDTQKIKLWITGYSRGGATANLVAATLPLMDDIPLSGDWKNQIYAYTFEAPLNTTDANALSDQYNYIFNIVNPSDLVPKVAPEAWGFYRYGRDIALPSEETDPQFSTLVNDLKNAHAMITGETEYSYPLAFVWKIPGKGGINELQADMTPGEFLTWTVDILAQDIIGSREIYFNEYQSFVVPLVEVLLGQQLDMQQVVSLFWNLSPLTYNEADFIESIKQLYPLVSELDTGAKLLKRIISNQESYQAIQGILGNLGLMDNHFPIVCFSWMHALSDNTTWINSVTSGENERTYRAAYQNSSALNGLHQDDNGVWCYYVNGRVQYNYTGLVEYKGSYFYVENGVLDWDYTGVVEHFGTFLHIENGLLDRGYTGLAYYNEMYIYIENGRQNTEYTGLVEYDGTFFYVENGMLNWNYTGLSYYNGIYFYVENGMLNWDYTGLAILDNNFFYVENGMLNWNYTGLVYYAGTFFYVENGMLNWNYTGLSYYAGLYFYVENGMLNWNYTGLAILDNNFFYIENGTLNWNYTGLAYYEGIYFYIENGMLNWSYYGLCNYAGVWFYIEGGMLTWNYNGTVTGPDGNVYEVAGSIVQAM